jgi:ABC-type phosphate transport system auxiliary subunit
LRVLRTWILLTLLGALLMALLSACSEDEMLSREQYASRLDAMCESFAAREQEIGEPRTLEDLVEKGPRVVDAFEETIVDKIHDLNAPSEIAAQADRLAELTDRQRDVLAELVEAAKQNDVAEVQELASKNATLNEQTNALARNLGASSCAKN